MYREAYSSPGGLKPTYGRISTHGVVPLAWSTDTVGILTRSVQDAAIMLQAMAGHDDNDPNSSTIPLDDYVAAVNARARPPRIGVVREFFYDNAQEDVLQHTDAVVDLLRRAGAFILEVKLPASFHDHEAARNVVVSVDAAAFHREMHAENPDDYGPFIRQTIETGLLVSGVDYVQAQRVRQQFRRDAEAILSDVDLLLTPGAPSAAPRDLTTTGDPVFQGAWTSSGLPAISIPSGLDGQGMPLGIQLVGASFAEARLLSAARWCETVLNVELKPPGLE